MSEMSSNTPMSDGGDQFELPPVAEDGLTQFRITDYLPVIRNRTGMPNRSRSQGGQADSPSQGGDPNSGGIGAQPGGGGAQADRNEARRLAQEQAKRDHDSKKKLPKISEVTWTHRTTKSV